MTENNNDIQLEAEVKEAFGQLRRPAGLDAKTMAYIQEQGEDKPQGLIAAPGGLLADRAKSSRKAANKSGFHGFAAKAVAACLAVSLVGFGGLGAYSVPVAYADVVSEGGVELCVNAFDRVVRVECLDDAGVSAIDSLKAQGVELRGKSYEEALEILAASGLCPSDDTSHVEVTIACHDQERGKKMERQASQCLGNQDHSCKMVSMEDHDASHPAEKHGYGNGNGQGNGNGNGQENCESNGSGQGDGNGQGLHDGTGNGKHGENHE